jgi:hypothetical protein
MSKQRVVTFLPEYVYERVEELAQERDRTVGQFVGDLLMAYCLDRDMILMGKVGAKVMVDEP